MTAVDEESYTGLISLMKGEFAVPVKDRSRAQKAACIRFCRHSSKFKARKVDGLNKLFFQEKEVLKTEFVHFFRPKMQGVFKAFQGTILPFF